MSPLLSVSRLRTAAAAAVLAGAGGVAQAQLPVPGPLILSPHLSINVLYQAGPAPAPAAVLPAPSGLNVLLRLQRGVPAVYQAPHQTTYMQCGPGTYHGATVTTGAWVTATQLGEATAQAVTVDLAMEVSGVKSLPKASNSDCAAGAPVLYRPVAIHQQVAVPLDGTPTLVRLNDGGQIALKVLGGAR
jgi:hypothetical protein